jgi:cation/acetate symporter
MEFIPVLFVLAITVATIGLGIYATRASKTASDFFVAGRSVNVFWNASAISGEYLSAASFMGVAGLVMKSGYDAMWYPVCYATGYLFLLLFIAGPLRRFGAYTIPDFAEGRFDSPTFRKVAVTFVLLIGLFYTMPQMKGAGAIMGAILNWPYWAGIVVVGSVITFNVALGGMKSITFVQAFQYWAKLFAISAPLFVLMSVFGGYAGRLNENAEDPKGAPQLSSSTELKFKGKKDAPANAVAFSTLGPTQMILKNGALLDKISTVRKAEPGEDPMPPDAITFSMGGMDYTAATPPGGPRWSPPRPLSAAQNKLPLGTMLISKPFVVTKGGEPVLKDGKEVKTAAKIEFAGPLPPATAILGTFPAGTHVPNSPPNKKWLEPFGPFTSKDGFPLLYTYSLIVALICGTAGLPHILVRFYTNPDGRAAKRTTLWVMVMLGAFYVCTPIWGALGRSVVPGLYANNSTDLVLIKLPAALDNPLLAQILVGITSAGAFAAFMSTFSGLLVSMSGAMAHDIYGKILRPGASQQSRLKAFKISAVIIGAVSMVLGLGVEAFDITKLVGWAFAIGAASYFPLLLLGSWWRGLTKYGAAAGMLIGGFASLAAIVSYMLLEKKLLSIDVTPLTRTLIEQPAIWGVPLSLGIMFVVSKMTSGHVPKDATVKMLRLHAPEEMGISKDYIAEH